MTNRYYAALGIVFAAGHWAARGATFGRARLFYDQSEEMVMRWEMPSGHIWRRPIFGLIDSTAKKINPLLISVAVMLAIIDLSCFSALEIGRRHPPRPEPSRPTVPTPTPGHSVLSPSTQG